MKQVIMTALLGVALTFAACGGDDDDSSPTQPSGSNGGNTPTQSNSTADNGSNDQGNGGGSTEDKRAVVTIGEERFEFDLSDLCMAAFGNLAGVGRSTDGRDIRINISVPPEDWETSDEDWEPPSIRVDDAVNDVDWRAGGEVISEMVEPGVAEVTSFSIDGKRASGEATFVDLYAVMRGEVEPVEGTFDFNCN